MRITFLVLLIQFNVIADYLKKKNVNSCVSFVFGWGETGREHKKGGPAYNARQAKTIQQEK